MSFEALDAWYDGDIEEFMDDLTHDEIDSLEKKSNHGKIRNSTLPFP